MHLRRVQGRWERLFQQAARAQEVRFHPQRGGRQERLIRGKGSQTARFRDEILCQPIMRQEEFIAREQRKEL